MKRLIDLVISLVLAPVALLLCAMVGGLYILIERESPIFKQRRVGRHEREFTIYKLRTMRAGTADAPTHEVDEKKVTRLGGLLRVSKLDELPQLWNVVLGEMSLVGPRPCLVSQVHLIAERRRLNVFSIRPGVTGPSQVKGIDMSEPVKLAISDAEYLSNSGFLYDMRIIIATISGAGFGDHVTKKE